MWNDDERDTSGIVAAPIAQRTGWLSIEEVLRKYYASQRFDEAPSRCEEGWKVKRSHKSRRAAAAPPPPPPSSDAAAELNDEIMDKIIYRKCWYS